MRGQSDRLLALLLPPVESLISLQDVLRSCPQLQWQCVGAGPSSQLISSSPFLATASVGCFVAFVPWGPTSVWVLVQRAGLVSPCISQAVIWETHSFGRPSGRAEKAWWRHHPLRSGQRDYVVCEAAARLGEGCSPAKCSPLRVTAYRC